MRAIKRNLPLLTLVLLILFSGSDAFSQTRSRPDDPPPQPHKSPTSAPPPQPPPPKIVKPLPRKPEPRANITVAVQPTDSRVMLDSQESSAPDSRGIVIFNNLTLTTHRLVVRRTGYGDYSLEFTPVAGNAPLTVKLEPLPGVLQVIPTVEEASIEIKRLDGEQETINLIGSIHKLEVPPGDYQVTTSKSGYKAVVRNVTIAPAHTFSLEPKLDPIELPKRSVPARRVVTMPMTSSVEAAGKFLIVRLRGASGETTASGSIDVMAPKATSSWLDIKGSLSGLPCEVEFVRLENVAEASLLETPGPSNQWSTVAIRVRPKDLKRLVHFVINWRSLEKSAAVIIPNLERRNENIRPVLSCVHDSDVDFNDERRLRQRC